MKNFAELFKKYRLRSEYKTLAEFGEALAQKGFLCEESLFSHWQKGSRTPTNRSLLLKMIELFVENNAIRDFDEANQFLAATGLGFLTEYEREKLHLTKEFHIPFQVPSEIQHFTGRQDILAKIIKNIDYRGVILLYGAPGVGKTALAIKIAHRLKKNYPDGVLWYKIDSSNIMDILLSIAKLYGEDIHSIKDAEVRASVVRTLLEKKKVLLIFDNATKNDRLSLLTPNVSQSTVIFTSQDRTLPIATTYDAFSVESFTQQESLELFQNIFDKKYVIHNQIVINEICKKIGYLPLAVTIVAAHMKQFNVSAKKYLEDFNENAIDLQTYTYEDRNLLHAIAIGFSSLENSVKELFISLGIFEGKDFSIESVAYINNFTENETEKYLHQLLSISFIEPSRSNRYRIHPLMRAFARKNLKNSAYYLRAAAFYENKLIYAQQTQNYKNLVQDIDNIIFIVKQCYEARYWDQIITIWNPLEKLLSETNEMKRLRILKDDIDMSPTVNVLQQLLTIFLFVMLFYWIILNLNKQTTSQWNYGYSLIISILPMTSGLIGIIRSKYWGLFKSNIGKALFMISLGSFSWFLGNVVWSYYNFILKVDLPYPSLSDAGFFAACFFWIAGIIYLIRATGTKFKLSQKGIKLFLLSIPLVLIIASYYFLIFHIKRSYDSNTPLHMFFDIYYPTMDIIILSLSTIIFGLSVNFFGGKYRLSLFSILGGFLLMYFADFAFSYSTAVGEYYNGGLADLLFSFAFYMLSWGSLNFYFTPQKKNSSLVPK